MQDDGRFLILLVTALGAFASIAAIVFELGVSNSSAAGTDARDRTIALSWTTVHTTFALHYAHDYYRATSPADCSFRAAISMITPTIGILCIFPS